MKKAVRVIVIILLLAGIASFMHSHPDLTMQSLLDWQPENLLMAAIVILAMYVVKCLVVVVPLIVIQVLTGHLFEMKVALVLNIIGLIIVLILPYWLGRKKGKAFLGKLTQRYPKFESLIGRQHENDLLLCFILRVVPVLPGDILTLYFGASGTRFLYNTAAGFLGALPTLILATILGESISDPSSPAFWRAVVLNIAWVAVSAFGYWIYKRHHQAGKRKEK